MDWRAGRLTRARRRGDGDCQSCERRILAVHLAQEKSCRVCGKCTATDRLWWLCSRLRLPQAFCSWHICVASYLFSLHSALLNMLHMFPSHKHHNGPFLHPASDHVIRGMSMKNWLNCDEGHDIDVCYGCLNLLTRALRASRVNEQLTCWGVSWLEE